MTLSEIQRSGFAPTRDGRLGRVLSNVPKTTAFRQGGPRGACGFAAWGFWFDSIFDGQLSVFARGATSESLLFERSSFFREPEHRPTFERFGGILKNNQL
jgi:hypothetical protein